MSHPEYLPRQFGAKPGDIVVMELTESGWISTGAIGVVYNKGYDDCKIVLNRGVQRVLDMVEEMIAEHFVDARSPLGDAVLDLRLDFPHPEPS